MTRIWKILLNLYFLTMLYSYLYAQDHALTLGQAVVLIRVDFKEHASRSSSGFLIKKQTIGGEKFFVVMTTHCLHRFEEWTPKEIDYFIKGIQTPIKIPVDERFESNYSKYNENKGEYADISVVEVTNYDSFKQLKDDIAGYFLDYKQLAEAKVLNNIGNDPLFIYSTYGVREAVLGERTPNLPRMGKLLGYSLLNCRPALRLNGGDSGALVVSEMYSEDFIIGMLLQREDPNNTNGFMVDSIRIKETIDLRK